MKLTLKIFLVAFIILSVVLPMSSKALGFNLLGGQISTVQPCANGFLITIGPPRPAIVMYTPGVSKLYMFYRIQTPKVWALGTASGVSECVREGASNLPAPDGTIIMVGTSMR